MHARRTPKRSHHPASVLGALRGWRRAELLHPLSSATIFAVSFLPPWRPCPPFSPPALAHCSGVDAASIHLNLREGHKGGQETQPAWAGLQIPVGFRPCHEQPHGAERAALLLLKRRQQACDGEAQRCFGPLAQVCSPRPALPVLHHLPMSPAARSFSQEPLHTSNVVGQGASCVAGRQSNQQGSTYRGNGRRQHRVGFDSRTESHSGRFSAKRKPAAAHTRARGAKRRLSSSRWARYEGCRLATAPMQPCRAPCPLQGVLRTPSTGRGALLSVNSRGTKRFVRDNRQKPSCAGRGGGS